MSWRGFASFIGSLLLLTGLGGFALLMAAPSLPTSILEPLSSIIGGDEPHPRDVAAAATTDLTDPTVTRLSIPAIQLDTAVVRAARVEHDGASTWDVPNLVAGHAEGTAAPGQPGTTVLIGHVTSVTRGHVFEHLAELQPGALVRVFSAERGFDYRVTDVRSVSRTDVSVLEPSSSPSLSMITCSGLWLPTVWDYTERLVVHAELISD